MSSAKISIWRDTGFTEGAVEVPSVGSPLASPDHIFTDVNVTVDSLFTTLKLKAPFEDLYDCSYMRIELDMNNGDDIVFYGWIDDVVPLSDTAGYPNTQISWHVDLWRTYISKVSVTKGTVVRRAPDNDWQPPQSVPQRYRYPSSSIPLLRNNGIWWVLFKVVFKQSLSAKQFTTTTFGAFPVDINTPDRSFNVMGRDVTGTSEVTVATIPFDHFAGGLFEEYLKLDPEAIISVFLSPVDPFNCSIYGKDTYYKDGLTVYHGEGIPGIETGFLCCTSDTPFHSYSGFLDDVVTADDMQSIAVTGFGGELIGELPWGSRVQSYSYRVVMDSNSAYLSVRMPSAYYEAYTMQPPLNSLMGTQFDIPLLPLEITTNAVGSYNWSGQRDADRARMWSNTLTGGLTSVGGIASAYQSGVNMGMFGQSERIGTINAKIRNDQRNMAWNMKMNPELYMRNWTLNKDLQFRKESVMAGASAMGLATAKASGIGMGVSLVSSGISNIMQDTNNVRARAAQTPSLAMTGTGFDALHYGQLPTLVTLRIDEYSERQYVTDVALNGISVTEPFANGCELPTSGPIQIADPIVVGSVPTSAKGYIAQRLEAGVRLV